jgi:hypothetical protein
MIAFHLADRLSHHASLRDLVSSGGLPEANNLPQTVSKPVETATAVPTDALIKLANHWRNCDEDNDLVKVSRLALAEVLAYVQMVRPDLNGGQQGATKPVVLEPLPTDRYAVDDPWHRPPPINEPQGSSNPEGGK